MSRSLVDFAALDEFFGFIFQATGDHFFFSHALLGGITPDIFVLRIDQKCGPRLRSLLWEVLTALLPSDAALTG